MSLFYLISCGQHLSLSSSGESDQENYQMSDDPQIYLSRQNISVNIQTINRENFVLHLSDKFIFSDQEKTEPSVNWGKLKPLEQEESTKVKVSSFCSYNKEQTDGEHSRIVQEISSETYIWTFSIFELLPKKILLRQINKTFYCSFVFAFKDSKGVFHYYNIAQQTIEPSFTGNAINKLSLIRETETGRHLPVDNEVINKENLHKILLLNTTEIPAQKYHLFCEDLKIISFSTSESTTIPLFVYLINLKVEQWPENVKKCRVFSEDGKRLTGMSNIFNLDFNSIRNESQNIKIQDIDLTQIKDFLVMDIAQMPKEGGQTIPINSHFYFSYSDQTDSATQNYNFIDITVNTLCFNKHIFGRGKVSNNTYTFPFRRKFPIMAVTPKKAFVMNIGTYSDMERIRSKFLKTKKRFYVRDRITRKKYTSYCIYKLTLTNRHRPENKQEFEEKNYSIKWENKPYGVQYRPLDNYKSITPFPNWENKAKISERFLRLEDIDTNKAGHISFNFFDTVDDDSFFIEGHKVNHVKLECHSGKNKDSKSNSIIINWPYSILDNPLLLKTFFQNPEIRAYIRKNIVAICRLMLYEDELLRYFSGEMKITI